MCSYLRFCLVPPTGFEPVISTLKGWRPRPLDDGDGTGKYTGLPLAVAPTVFAMCRAGGLRARGTSR